MIINDLPSLIENDISEVVKKIPRANNTDVEKFYYFDKEQRLKEISFYVEIDDDINQVIEMSFQDTDNNIIIDKNLHSEFVEFDENNWVVTTNGSFIKIYDLQQK